MVELARLTAERRADLRDERRRAQVAAARNVLERSTLMLLTSSKVRFYQCNYIYFVFLLVYNVFFSKTIKANYS